MMDERIRADFAARERVDTRAEAWLASPAAGVERIPLDRVGGEVARATSLVRYAPGSRFAAHAHGGGEEILVLEGTFADEHGRYPAGTYLRNPPGTAHAPRTDEGCVLFVKLWQFRPGDERTVRIDTRAAPWYPGLEPGLTVLPLHEHDGESVALVRWQPGTRFNAHTHPGGEEIFVLEGVFQDELGDYAAGTWLRNPPWSRHAPRSEPGCLIYVKVGHLAELAAGRADAPPA